MKIVEECAFCHKEFDLKKDNIFNFIPKYHLKSAGISLETAGEYIYEVYICKNCFEDYLRVFQLKKSWKWIYQVLNFHITPFKLNKKLRLSKCRECGIFYHPTHGNQKYCSSTCFKVHRVKYKRENAKKSYKKKVKQEREKNPILCKYCNRPLDPEEHGNKMYHSECRLKYRAEYLEEWAISKGYAAEGYLTAWQMYQQKVWGKCGDCGSNSFKRVYKKSFWKYENGKKVLYYKRVWKCFNCGKISITCKKSTNKPDRIWVGTRRHYHYLKHYEIPS